MSSLGLKTKSEEGKSLPVLTHSVEFYYIRVLRILEPSVHLIQVLLQHQRIGNIFVGAYLFEGPGRMHELTAHTVRTIEVFVVLFTELGLILGGNMLFLLEFIFSMCKGATISKLALASSFPILAHLYQKLLHSILRLLSNLPLFCIWCGRKPGCWLWLMEESAYFRQLQF